MQTYNVAIADDHNLIRNGLAALINSFSGYKVLFQACNGNHLIEQIENGQLPDLVLLDINMPEKDGYETARWLKSNQPNIKVMALSMYEKESSIIRMLRHGVKGYLLKMAEPAELKAALDSLVHKGFHYSELVTGHLLHSIQRQDEHDSVEGCHLTAREIEFLKYSCTEMTYKEIANKMFVSPRTIDGYRDSLCEKLQVSSRVGLVVYAFRHGIVHLDNEK